MIERPIFEFFKLFDVFCNIFDKHIIFRAARHNSVARPPFDIDANGAGIVILRNGKNRR